VNLRLLNCGFALLVSGCAMATLQVPAGSLVRLRLDTPDGFGHPVTGFYQGATRDSILLRRDSAGPTNGFLRTRVLSLEVGRRESARNLGALAGLAGGILAATAFAPAGAERRRCEEKAGDACGFLFEWFIAKDVSRYLLGAGVGAMLGGLVGGAIPVTHWTPVPLERLQLSVRPLPGGRTGFGAAFSF
jgi:hypothetical protein